MKIAITIDSQIINDLNAAISSFPLKAPALTPNLLDQFYELERKEIYKVFHDAKLVDEMQEMISNLNKLVGVMNNNVKEGIKWYRAFERVIRLDFEGLEYLYLKQWAISVEALYYYKIKKNRLAFSLTLECISLNEMLIKEGIPSLLFRSIEQNKNISKILFKKGEKQNAFRLKRSLLEYFVDGHSENLYGQALYDSNLWNKYPLVREGFAYGYFAELVYELATIKQDQEDYFSSVFRSMKIKEPANCHIIYDWIELKRFWYDGDFENFLLGFIKYMAKETMTTLDFIKVSLIADVKLLLTKANHEHYTGSLTMRLQRYVEDNFDGMDYFKNSYTKEAVEFIDRFDINFSMHELK